MWNTDGCRTVTRRIRQHYWCFVARDQALVGVGGRVSVGVDRFSMLDDTADVEQCHFRQAAVFVASEQVVTVLGQRHVAVHTGTVIAKHWFWHEGRGFAKCVSHVVNHVFVDLDFVSFFGQGVEAGCHFVLTRGCHFVVVSFNNQTHFFHGQTHGRTQILRGVDRRYREVAAFYCRTVAFVAAFVFGRRVPCAFDIIDSDVRTGDAAAETHIIKQEEFWLWPEQNGVRDAGSTQEIFCTLRR